MGEEEDGGTGLETKGLGRREELGLRREGTTEGQTRGDRGPNSRDRSKPASEGRTQRPQTSWLVTWIHPSPRPICHTTVPNSIPHPFPPPHPSGSGTLPSSHHTSSLDRLVPPQEGRAQLHSPLLPSLFPLSLSPSHLQLRVILGPSPPSLRPLGFRLWGCQGRLALSAHPEPREQLPWPAAAGFDVTMATQPTPLAEPPGPRREGGSSQAREKGRGGGGL